MNIVVQQPELQQRTLRLYGELLCRRASWARELVFAAFPGAAGSGIAAAASLVGAGSLVVDSDAASMKAHFRDGAFDFVVNTLDEALRAIKNEIRKGSPLSIGLVGEPKDVVAEAAERGLSAGFVLNDSSHFSDEDLRALCGEDADIVDVAEPTSRFAAWLEEKHWIAVEAQPAAPGETTDVVSEPVREAWLRGLATHQRSVRGRVRWVWMRAEA